MRITKTFDLPAAAEAVEQMLCGEAFNVDEGVSRADCVSAEFKLIERTEQRVVFEVHYQEYKRSRLGRIDKSGTNPGKTHNTYDTGARTLRWVYSSPATGDRFSLTGQWSIEPRGDGCRLTYSADLEIRIPLIGNKIAKLIAKEVEDDFPRLERIIRTHAV